MLLLSIPRVKQSTYHPCAAQPVSWVACACAYSQDGGAVRKLKSVRDQRGQKVIKTKDTDQKKAITGNVYSDLYFVHVVFEPDDT